MPNWILSMFGPLLLDAALRLLEAKFPGLGPIIEGIVSYLENHPLPTEGVKTIQSKLGDIGVPPTTVGNS